MNKDDKDILSGIDTYSGKEDDTLSSDDDILINGLFASKNAQKSDIEIPPVAPAKEPAMPRRPGVPAPKKPARSDARYTMTPAEIDTLAAAAEDAVADGRYGAALDSVFFTAGAAREALKNKLNIRIPMGSSDTDLPVIAAAALIDSYLEFEDINSENIEEKLHLIIESSEDERGARPSSNQVKLRVFECALILCVQAEQSGRHAEIKKRLYGDKDSFLRKFLEANIDEMMQSHRKELHHFHTSVKMQSGAVSGILDEYMSQSKYAAPFIKRFFAETGGILAAAITIGVICLASVVLFIVAYFNTALGNIISFAGDDGFVIAMITILLVLLCIGMAGVSWLVYTAGEHKDELKK